jgi:hypothetical protein
VDNLDKPIANSLNPVNANCGLFDGLHVADSSSAEHETDSACVLIPAASPAEMIPRVDSPAQAPAPEF